MPTRPIVMCLLCFAAAPGLAAEPPPPDPVELGQQAKDAAGRARLIAYVEGTAAPQDRSKAIRALPRTRDDALVAKVTTWTTDASVWLKVEATIKLYHWGQVKVAYPLLVSLRDQGVAIRRAFQTNDDVLHPTYDAAAEAFFREGLASKNGYVRVDSAVGLIQLEKAGGALAVIDDVLLNEPKFTTRLAAVNYLVVVRDAPGVRGLLQKAAKDADEHVSARAKAVLAPLEK